jgi:hypothetical protein
LDYHRQQRIKPLKIDAMGEAFYAMSEDEYGDWLDALPRDEFVEYTAVLIELDERSRRASARAA